MDEPQLRLLPALPVRPGAAVEICGDRGTGKSTLLNECIVRCILPGQVDGRPVGGHGASAILIDTEGTFSVAQLANTLNGQLMSTGITRERATSEARRCMEGWCD